MELYTIPYSHYCEAARWALELKGVRFVEKPYLPGFHAVISPISRLRGAEKGDSTARPNSVPLLYDSETKKVLAMDSWECIKFNKDDAHTEKYGNAAIDLRVPIEQNIQNILDQEIGPATRCIAYSYLLDRKSDGGKGDHAFNKMMQKSVGCSWLERFIVGFSPVRSALADKMYSLMCKNKEHICQQREALKRAASKLEGILEKRPVGTFYADKEMKIPTLAAMATAALMYPVLFNDEVQSVLYNGKKEIEWDDLPMGYQKEILFWRGTKLGRLSMEIYQKFRK